MTNPALSRDWGNPAAPTYKKRCIRRITAGGKATYVHADIQDLAGRLADAAGVALEGWVAPRKGDDDHPRHYGIAVRAEGPIDGANAYGFEPYEDGWYVFMGTPAAAKKLTETAEAQRMEQRVEDEVRHEHEWGTGRPGERELELGDKGDDVQFFQMVFAAPEQHGIFDSWCGAMAKLLQERWGVPVTGTVNENVWKSILPTAMTYSIGYGDSGHIVRVLQAALVAYDWDYDVLVTGRFDEVTHRAVRKLQAEYGLRQSSDMSAPEWTILLGKPPRNVVP
jgi:hypothetical protein